MGQKINRRPPAREIAPGVLDAGGIVFTGDS